MAEWTYADFQGLIPEMATVPSGTFDLFARFASNQINRSRFSGDRLILAGCYLTAHLISTVGASGVAPTGPLVASESVGGVSVSYAVSAAPAGDMSASKYGAAFARLARLAGAGGFVP